MTTSWVVVTDLDGTLLDPETYSWEPARETIRRLQERAIPIVFCTSKTRAETELLRAEIGVRDPYIVEDGGAICWPEGTQVLGVAHAELLVCFRELQARTGEALRGLSEMTDAEFSADSGLAFDRTALARQREFDEPFRILRDEEAVLPAIERAAAGWGFRITRGGRYFHLHGAADKGTAVSHLLRRYPGARSIGLGDSRLDLPLLQAVHVPVAVARPDGTYDETLVAGVAGLEKTNAPGPEGWSQAIARFVLVAAPGR